MTKLLGVIGDPIAHSMSPLIHNGWLRDMGYDAAYEAMHVSAGAFDAALETLSRRNTLGVNVTLPHKGTALAVASEVSSAAKTIGAANTLTHLGENRWRADNTDAPGFLSALGEMNPSTDKILILGAGGSARALVYALVDAGFAVTVLNRTEQKAKDLVAELGSNSTQFGPLNQYAEYIDAATIVINTTSMGYTQEAIALPEGRNRLFFDISYGAIAAQQIAIAREKGWRVKDGLTMLVAQAAYSFEIWFGEKPNIEAGIRRCEMALKAVS